MTENSRISTRQKNMKRRPIIEDIYDILYGDDELNESSANYGTAKKSNQDGTHELHKVEEILDRRQSGLQFSYKVKWIGLPMEHCTWEPTANLHGVHAMVKAFNKRYVLQQKSKDQKPANTPPPIVVKVESTEPIKPAPLPTQETKSVDNDNDNVATDDQLIILDDSPNGDFRKGDTPQSVIYSHRVDKSGNPVLYFKVTWNPRSNGEVPLETLYTNAELKELYPRALVEFYEERLKFVVRTPTTGNLSSGGGPHQQSTSGTKK